MQPKQTHDAVEISGGKHPIIHPRMKTPFLLLTVLAFFLHCQASAQTTMNIEADQLAKLCTDTNFGFQKDSSVSDVWKTILNVAQTQPEAASVWTPVMIEALQKTRSELEKAKTIAEKAGKPATNVWVEGVPLRGMDPEQVKDPAVRATYKAAIEANNTIVSQNNYYNQLRLEYQSMLADATVLTRNSGENSPSVQLLNKAIEEGKPVTKSGD